MEFSNENSANEEISKKSLESLGFLMKYNCECKLESNVFGLEKQIAANQGLLEELLQFTIRNLLLMDFSSELLEAYAIMLLPLITCQMTSFSAMMTQLISTQSDVNVKNIFVNACQDLVTKNGVSFEYKFGRKNCEIFMKNLEEFLLRVKGFMLTK